MSQPVYYISQMKIYFSFFFMLAFGFYQYYFFSLKILYSPFIFQKYLCLSRLTIKHNSQFLHRKIVSIFINFNQTDFNYFSPIILDKKQHYPTKFEWEQNLKKLMARCFIIFNCFVHCESAFFWEKVLFINRSTCQSRFTIYDKSQYCINFIYINLDLVFSLHHQSGACFGHFITDILPKFVLIPNYLYKNAKFLTNKENNKRIFVDDAYCSFGIPQKNLIQLSNKALFSKTAIILEISECIFPNPFILNQFRQMATIVFNLDRNLPFKYILYNRNFGHWRLHRRIINFNEIFLVAKKKFPSYNFEKIDCILKVNISNQAIFFNQFKLIFAVDGAGLANTIFMQKNTILIEILHSSMSNYLGFFILSMSFSRLFINERDQNILLSANSPNVFSSSLFIKLISMAFNYLENKKTFSNFNFISSISIKTELEK